MSAEPPTRKQDSSALESITFAQGKKQRASARQKLIVVYPRTGSRYVKHEKDKRTTATKALGSSYEISMEKILDMC